MKLLIQTAMIFFGTLLCAAVVALGEPEQADDAIALSVQGSTAHQSLHNATRVRSGTTTVSARTVFGLR